MPKIDTKSQTITWDWEDFLAGLHPQYSTSSQIYKGSYSETSFNPLRYLGYACPGENIANSENSNLIDGLLKAIDVSPTTQHGYAAGGTKVLDINGISGSISACMDIASNVFDDIIRYNKSDGTEYMFASYNGAATGDIARILTSDNSHTDSYWQGTAGGAALDKDYTHPMIVGDDDVLYIGDGNIVRGLDGADSGTNIDVVLTLPAQYVIRGFAKLDNNTLVIFANNGSQTTIGGSQIGIFFWNYLDLDPYKSIYLQGVCGSCFNYKGTIAAVIGSISTDPGSNSRCLSIIYWDGSNFKTISGSQIYTTSLPLQRGVEVIGDSIYINVGAVLYIFSSPFPGIKSGLHKISVTSGTTSGCVKTISSGIQFISSNTSTTNYYLQYLNGYYTTGNWQGTNVDLYFPMRKKAIIKRMRVEFKDAVTGGRAVQVAFYNSAATLLAEMFSSPITVVSSGSLFIEREYAADDNLIPSPFESMYPLITWSTGSAATACPIIKRIIVEYELINI